MAYHEFKVMDFLGHNLKPMEKVYLLGGNEKLAEIHISEGLLMYDYKVVVKNFVSLTCFFEDEEGDRYSLICLLNGSSSLLIISGCLIRSCFHPSVKILYNGLIWYIV